jgi:hypothetical protein
VFSGAGCCLGLGVCGALDSGGSCSAISVFISAFPNATCN